MGKETLSECCGGRMIGGIQCEVCGSDGKLVEAEKLEADQSKVNDLRQED